MLICPKCKQPLKLGNNTYRCDNNHCYDVARKGYVNLLMSQVSGARHHGDDKLMAVSRRDFLSKGYYQPLAEAVSKCVPDAGTLADIGCGECYYLSYIKDAHPDLCCVGVDISKEILEVAGARTKPRGIVTAVASGVSLPFADQSFDALLSVFAPITDSELCRVLKDGGVLVRVSPGIDHLFELKAAVYDAPRKNDPLDMQVNGMQIIKTEHIRYTFKVDSCGAKSLFTMTPYYYKTSSSDREKLDRIDTLDITAEFDITVYGKMP